MVKLSFQKLILIFVVIVIIAGVSYALLTREQIQAPSTGLPGLTAEEARRIVPVISKISLTAESMSEGVLLRWVVTKEVSLNYYDVYRRTPGSIGWGELIERIEAKNDYLGPFEYVDKKVIPSSQYVYQILGVRLSGKYEITEEVSNSIEVTVN